MRTALAINPEEKRLVPLIQMNLVQTQDTYMLYLAGRIR